MTPERLHLRIMHEEVDRAMVEGGRKHKVTCARGCSYCCYQQVGATELDAVAALDAYTGSMPRLVAALERSAAGPEGGSAYFDAQIPCAFLVDDECSIYHARPVACRTTVSLSPPKLCAPPSAAVRQVHRLDVRPLLLATSRATFQIAIRLGYESLATGYLAELCLHVLKR